MINFDIFGYLCQSVKIEAHYEKYLLGSGLMIMVKSVMKIINGWLIQSLVLLVGYLDVKIEFNKP